VLLHLNEIERRKLHLKLGYASMFDYCTSGLGYSSSAAARRIRTARCMARYPEVLALLKANEVNLSTVSQVSRLLTAENKDALLQRMRGKSQREVDLIVAEYEPRSMPRERVTQIVVQVPLNAVLPRGAASAPKSGGELLSPVDSSVLCNRKCDSPNDLESDHCRSGSELLQPATEKRMHLSFSVSEGFMAKLEKIRSLAWHQLPANASLEQVFELAMDYFIEKRDPIARTRVRRKDSKENEAATVIRALTRSRHVPAAVREAVFTRDDGRCTYVGFSGKRCNSTDALQIDHVEPFSRGGLSALSNLRLLCAHHNRLEAERLLGASPTAWRK